MTELLEPSVTVVLALVTVLSCAPPVAPSPPSAPAPTRAELGAEPPEVASEQSDIAVHVLVEPIAHERDVFVGCFEAARARNPKIAGTVRVQFTINKSGVVEEATATAVAAPEAVAPDAAMVACVIEGVQRIVFPKGATVHVVYPFGFRAS